MTDITNKITFDASSALATLKQLEMFLGAYNKALRESSKDGASLSKSQREQAKTFETIRNAAKLAQAELNKLAQAERKAAAEAAKAAAARKAAADKAAQANARAASGAVQQRFAGLGNRSKANLVEVAAVDKAIAAFEKLVTKTKTSEAQVRRILSNLRGSYQGAEREIRDSIIKILQAQGRLGKANIQVGARALANQTKEAAKETQGLAQSWANFSKLVAAGVAFRVISGINTQLRESFQNAQKLQTALSQAGTIAAPEFRNQAGLEQLGDQTRRISDAFGIDQVEVAEGLYQALSNQVGNTAETFLFLEESAAFAKATVSTLSESTDLLSGTLNAFGLDMRNNTRLMDLFFKTIELGRVKAKDLANTMGRIAPLASQIGVSLEETFASIATITIQGSTPDEALTQLSNVMQKLIRPSEGLNKVMKQLGVSSVRAGVAAFGFKGFLDELTSATNGTLEGTGELFTRVRALRGVLSLGAQDGDLYAETLRRIKEESDGAAKAAEQLIRNTPTAELQRSLQALKNTLTDDFGKPAIDALNAIIKGMGGADTAAKILSKTLIGLGIFMGGTLIFTTFSWAKSLLAAAAAAKGLTIATVLLRAAFAGVIALGVAAVLYGIYKAVEDNRDIMGELKEKVEETEMAYRKLRETTLKAVERTTANERKEVQTAGQEILGFLIERQKKYEENANRIKGLQKAVTDNLKDQLSDRLSLIDKFVQDVESAEKTAQQNIANITKNFRDFENQVNRGRFERNVARADPRRQAQLLQNRNRQLLESAERTASSDPQFSNSLVQEALRNAERLIPIYEELNGSTRGRVQGERQVTMVLEAQKRISQELVKQEQAKAAAAKASAAEVRREAAELTALGNQIQKEREALLKDPGTDTEAFNNQIASISQLEAEFEKKLQGFGTEALQRAGFQEQLRQQITGGFDSALTGKPLPLRLQTAEAVFKLREELTKGLTDLPVTLKVAFERVTGEKVGSNLSQQQDLVAQRVTEADTNLSNANKRQADAQLNQAKASQILALNTKALNAALVDYQNLINNTRVNNSNLGLLQNSAALEQAIQKAAQEAKNALAAGDIPKFEAALSRLNNAINQSKKGGIFFDPKFSNRFENLRDSAISFANALGQANTAGQELSQSRISFANAQSARTEIVNLQKELQTFKLRAEEGYTAAEARAKVFGLTIAEAKRQQDLLNESIRNQPAPKGGGQPAVNERYGGKIPFFQGGGFAPRGTDTVLAGLSPGESVIDAKNTRKFFSQISAIQSGQSPIFRSDGGSVTENTFTGDINVNLPSGSNLSDSRTVAKGLEREFRRKSSRRF